MNKLDQFTKILNPLKEKLNMDQTTDSINKDKKRYFSLSEKKEKEKEESKEVVLKFARPNTDQMVMQNDLLRSDLFTVKRDYKLKLVENKVLKSFGNKKIVFTGRELNQEHNLIFHLIISRSLETRKSHLPVKHPLGDFIKALGLKDGSKTREPLIKKLREISKGCLEFIRTGEEGIASVDLVRVLKDFRWDEDLRDENGKQYFTTLLDGHILKYFAKTSMTFVNPKEIRECPSNLSKWFLAFISTHREVYPIKLISYKELSGYQNDSKYFKREFKKVLKDFVDKKVIKSFEIYNNKSKKIEDDLVRVIKYSNKKNKKNKA